MATEGVVSLTGRETEESISSLLDGGVLEKLSQDYADYMTIEANKEKHAFNDAVEDTLNRLDDFLGTSDMIRSDVNLSLNTTLNHIYLKSKEIETHFDRIDRLEAFVAMVRSNVYALEAAVDKAEAEVGSVGPLKKAFSSFSIPFLSSKSKSTPPSTNAVPKFEPIPIYRTESYFCHASSSGQSPVNDSNSKMVEHNLPVQVTVDGACYQEDITMRNNHETSDTGPSISASACATTESNTQTNSAGSSDLVTVAESAVLSDLSSENAAETEETADK